MHGSAARNRFAWLVLVGTWTGSSTRATVYRVGLFGGGHGHSPHRAHLLSMRAASTVVSPREPGVRKTAWLCAAVLIFGLMSASPSAHAADRDCSDFKTQRAAQKFFKNHNPKKDPHRLDADGDGKACESLLCPCSGGCGNGPGIGHPAKRQKARVVCVVDGDTVKVRVPRRHKRPLRRVVRMIGIDTLEVYGGKECGVPKASRSLKRMLRKGTRVTLVRDRWQDNKDRYGPARPIQPGPVLPQGRSRAERAQGRSR